MLPIFYPVNRFIVLAITAIATTYLIFDTLPSQAENLKIAGENQSANCLFKQKQLRDKLSSNQLRAIIRLDNIQVTKPTVQGQAKLKLNPLGEGIAWTVKGQVGDRWGKFLLDTGASISMVTPEFLQGLHLKATPLPKEATRYALAGNDCKNIEANLYTIPLLTLGNAKIKNLQALQLSQTVIPAALDGVLGMDILDRFDLEIDPSKRELKLISEEKTVNVSNSAISLEMRQGVALVKVKLNQTGPFLFLIDTGAESTFISPSVAEALKLSPKTIKPIQVQGFCGLEPADYTTLQKVEVGNQTLEQVETVILTNTAVLDSLQVNGILGQNFLNQFKQVWHFGHSSTTSTGSLSLTPFP